MTNNFLEIVVVMNRNRSRFWLVMYVIPKYIHFKFQILIINYQITQKLRIWLEVDFFEMGDFYYIKIIYESRVVLNFYNSNLKRRFILRQ